MCVLSQVGMKGSSFKVETRSESSLCERRERGREIERMRSRVSGEMRRKRGAMGRRRGERGERREGRREEEVVQWSSGRASTMRKKT